MTNKPLEYDTHTKEQLINQDLNLKAKYINTKSNIKNVIDLFSKKIIIQNQNKKYN